MRLTPRTQMLIRQTAEEVFGPEAEVLLFGSRVDDTARGGDIDLLINASQPVEDRARKVLTLTARLQRRLGDRRIDVLVVDPQSRLLPVHARALETGVRL